MQRLLAVALVLLWLVGTVAFIYAFYPRGHQVLVTRWAERTATSTVATTTTLVPVTESQTRPATNVDWLRYVVLCFCAAVGGLDTVATVGQFYYHEVRGNKMPGRLQRRYTTRMAFTFGVVGALATVPASSTEREFHLQPIVIERESARNSGAFSTPPTMMPTPDYTPSGPTFVPPRDPQPRELPLYRAPAPN